MLPSMLLLQVSKAMVLGQVKEADEETVTPMMLDKPQLCKKAFPDPQYRGAAEAVSSLSSMSS